MVQRRVCVVPQGEAVHPEECHLYARPTGSIQHSSLAAAAKAQSLRVQSALAATTAKILQPLLVQSTLAAAAATVQLLPVQSALAAAAAAAESKHIPRRLWRPHGFIL
jgi:hypothetical protein